MGRGQKMKVPESVTIMSGMRSGVAHELERAPFEVWKQSYALHQLPPACAEGDTGAGLLRRDNRAVVGRRTSGGTRRRAGK